VAVSGLARGAERGHRRDEASVFGDACRQALVSEELEIIDALSAQRPRAVVLADDRETPPAPLVHDGQVAFEVATETGLGPVAADGAESGAAAPAW